MHAGILLLLPIALTSCLAAGVPYTNNPDTLLAYSVAMNRSGRAWRMKEFIDKAYVKYLKGNNQSGIAECYRLYGKYYFYHPEGAAIDNDSCCVTDPERLKIALDYLEKAINISKSFEDWAACAVTAKEKAQVYEYLDDKNNCFAWYDQARTYYAKFLTKNTAKEFPYTMDFSDFYSVVDHDQKLSSDYFKHLESK